MIENRKMNKYISKKTEVLKGSDAVFQIVGLKNFTMESIASYMGIAKGTLYNYFDSKDALLAELCSKVLYHLLALWKSNTYENVNELENLKRMILVCYKFYEEYPEPMNLIIRMERLEYDSLNENYNKTNLELLKFVTHRLRIGQKNGMIRKDIDPEIANLVLRASCVGIINFLMAKRDRMNNELKLDKVELIETYANIFLSGIAAKPNN